VAGGAQVPGVLHVLVEHAPAAQRLLEAVDVFRREFGVEGFLVDGLGQQLSHIALEVGGKGPEALGLAAESIDVVDIGVVIELDEGLQLHAEFLAVVQQGVVVVRDPPGSGIEEVALGEIHGLGGAAHFRELVAGAQRPVPPAGSVLILENPDAIAGLFQFVGRQHSGQARAQHDHRGPLARAGQVGRAKETAFGRVTKGGHHLVHGRCAAHQADGVKKLPARRRLATRFHEMNPLLNRDWRQEDQSPGPGGRVWRPRGGTNRYVGRKRAERV
jgi:hypothetical protein